MIRRLKTYLRPTNSTCFVHIPKCGGTSIVASIYEGYKYHPAADFIRLSNLHPIELSSRASKYSADLFDEDLLLHRSKIMHYLLRSNKRCRYAHGHFPFSQSLHRTFRERFHFVTVLRDPVQRWFSHFYYSKSHPSSPFYIPEPLEAFIETARAADLGSLYTLYLTDPRKHHRDTGALKKTALENLSLFSVIGILEDLDRFAVQFEAAIGIKLQIPHKNRTTRQKEEVEQYKARVTALCQSDIEIYERAKEISRGKGAGT